MWTIVAGVFLLLHGMVHLLYAGQSARYFELRPGMTWPDGSWLLSRLLGNEPTRLLAILMLLLSTLAFVAAGFGLFFHQEWWRPVGISAATFSSITFILFWDGRFHALADKGAVGVLIDLTILFVIQILK